MDVKNRAERKALIVQNAAGEGPGIFGLIMDHKGWTMKTFHLYRGEPVPSDWRSYDLLVVMGGPMNVYEEETYPFLTEETRVIDNALTEGFPVIGFCLGAQLMAKASGAIVVKGPKKEIGWYPVRLTEQGMEDPLLKLFPNKFVVFQWHGDIFELPGSAVRLVTSSGYFNQGMRLGSVSYGFQFHFEITRDMIAEWLKTGKQEIEEMDDKDLPGIILANSDRYLPPLHSLGGSFFNNYLDMIESLSC